MTPEQLAQLHGVKLRALVKSHWPDSAAAEASTFGGGAALCDGPRGWLLIAQLRVERDPLDIAEPGESDMRPGWLGGAALWAERHGLREVHILLDHLSPDSARRATLLRTEPHLWRIRDRDLEAVATEPYVEPPVPPIDALAFAGVIEAAGADAVVEHGELIAEVLGLEVGRVVADPERGPALEVGVGRHDRLANAMLGGSVDSEAALRNAVEAVRAYRRPGALPHPANQLAPERWLRAVVCVDPSLVGAVALAPCAGTVPSRLKKKSPAIAIGADASGHGVVVGCSVGVDLDAPLVAADARQAFGHAHDRLVLVVAEHDDVPALREIAALLREPAEIAVVTRNWRDLPTG